MRVKMFPKLASFGKSESGIRRVIEAWHKFGKAFDIDYIEDDSENFDLTVIHAGTYTRYDYSRPIFAATHGLYFSADYASQSWEYEANRNVIETVRRASGVSVPSRWVQEIFQRDMRFSPYIIPHGIEWKDWQGSYDNMGYVLWSKNRAMDVCDPRPIGELAKRHTSVPFVTTFVNAQDMRQNIRVIGLQTHPAMKRIVQSAAVYLSSVKETFGIGTLEALAAGVPVLGFSHGGNLIMVEHGVNGYLAKPGDYDDLAEGLSYCLKHRKTLGDNAREMAKSWTWEAACEKLSVAFKETIEGWQDQRRPHQVDQSTYQKPVPAEAVG